MKRKDDNKQQSVAIFRYGLIAPALHMNSTQRGRYFADLAGKELEVPHYGRKKYRAGTFADWYAAYNRGNLDALKPSIRRDKGIARRISQQMRNIIADLLGRYPLISASGVYRRLIKDGHMRHGDFAESTLRKTIYRYHLRPQPGEVTGRKKYEKAHVNELWIADFMHGPRLHMGRKRKKTYLCAIIDDHSRVITGWGWFWRENCPVLASTLKSAIATFGVAELFYCDNGKVFRTNYLQLVAARLGFALVHSKPYDSPSRGKIERFFRTVRQKFLAELDMDGLTLEDLRSRFAAWLDTDYHKFHHDGIDERPLDRYLRDAAKTTIKRLADNELETAFLSVLERTVKNDSTISIANQLYEVPPRLIGNKIQLCFPIDHPDRISVMDDGKPVQRIHRVNPNENASKPHTGIHFKDMQDHEEEEGS